jgi:hypothetical protein
MTGKVIHSVIVTPLFTQSSPRHWKGPPVTEMARRANPAQRICPRQAVLLAGTKTARRTEGSRANVADQLSDLLIFGGPEKGSRDFRQGSLRRLVSSRKERRAGPPIPQGESAEEEGAFTTHGEVRVAVVDVGFKIQYRINRYFRSIRKEYE